MSEQKNPYTPEYPEESSVDDLIAETRYQLEQMDRMDEPRQAQPEPEPEPEEDFVPDFGSAFDEYGDYEDPEQPPPQEPEDPEQPPLKKPRRPRKVRLVPLAVKVLLFVVLAALVGVGLGYGAWECARDFLAFGRSPEALTVTVTDEDDVESISHMLKERGVIQHPWLFRLYCSFTDSQEDMDPGTYEIYYNYDYHALVSGMSASSPNRTTVRVTIPEGMTEQGIFALMEKNKVCTVKELTECAEKHSFDYWFLEKIPYGKASRLEGFLFPDTYDFYENDDPERVINKLLSNFERKFSEEAQAQLEVLNEKLAQKLAGNGMDQAYIDAHRMDISDLITVASMIEKETANAEESGTIASVIYNRLTNPGTFPCLQIDATVVYALGGVDGPLTYEDTQVDSPYNTYKVQGLPAGPISNPGLSSITAALNPQDTDYYYYALDNETGVHHFTRTYEEHQQFLEGQSNEQ